MSDEPTTSDAPQPQTGAAWGDVIDETRKQGLCERLRVWWDDADHDARVGPFAGERLTGAEVFWLAACALAKTEERTLDEAANRLHEALTNFELRNSLSLSLLCLDGANLSQAQMGHACLRAAQLARVNLGWANLRGADLTEARLTGANLGGARLNGAVLRETHMEGVEFGEAHLEEAILFGGQLSAASFFRAHMKAAILGGSQAQGAQFTEAQMSGVSLIEAHLEGASFVGAYLVGANLSWARMERADLYKAQLEAADLSGAALNHADLRQASLDRKTQLTDARLTDARLDGVSFDNTNLSVVDWALVPRLHDERVARRARYGDEESSGEKRGKRKRRAERKDEFQAAVRAYRRLAVALQTNGMNEEAAGYTYRAQVCQRQVLRYSGWGKFGPFLFAGFLDALAGYGYKPARTLLWYLAIIAGFAGAYFAATHGALTFGLASSQVQPLQWYEALILSVSAFHGRGFFQPLQSLGDPVAILAAIEAIIGLLIEISFIATFTQRFFGSK